MILLNLFKIVTTLVVKVKLSSIALVRSVVICVDTWRLFARLVYFIRLTQTSHTSIVVFSVDEAQSQHVVRNDEVLVEFGYFFGGKL